MKDSTRGQVHAIKGAEVPSYKVIGTFEGECADSNITNENGLDITREVWEAVFDSDEYKKALKLGWYIGFLGHPDDPGCMDFEHACIVMTEGHIDENGKIYGKFNLIDTPVGRIVKAFIDSGVTFGISVRGVGDIVDNSVDPETFIFRGFDLVTFPAFPESIPTFTEIAASSDVKKKEQYSRICSAVKKNIEGVSTLSELNIIQSCFSAQSEPYKQIEKRKEEIQTSHVLDISKQKIEGMTNLYLTERSKAKELSAKVMLLESTIASMKKDQSRKMQSVERIMSSQLAKMDQAIADVSKQRKLSVLASKKLQEKVSSLQRSAQLQQDTIDSIRTESAKRSQEAILTSRKLQSRIQELERSNLKYKQKIEATETKLQERSSILASTQSELNKTVEQLSDSVASTSHLDASVSKLKAKIAECERLIESYQTAYAKLYATAVGLQPNSISVNASTTVEEIQKLIASSASVPSVQYIEPTPIDIVEDTENDALVTL